MKQMFYERMFYMYAFQNACSNHGKIERTFYELRIGDRLTPH